MKLNLILSAAFEKTGEEPTCAKGTVSIYHGDTKVGEKEIQVQLGAWSIPGDGLYVGRHAIDPLTDDYPGEAPYRFTGGTLRQVTIDVSGEPYLDLEREAELMLMRE